MATMRLYPHGLSAGVAPRKNDHERSKRGKTQGWTLGATRRNTRFLQSVETDKLTGQGYACTFTVKDCPESGPDWQHLIDTLVKRLRRVPGFLRFHCVTEWQRRCVPHLHMAVYFDNGLDLRNWLAGSVWVMPEGVPGQSPGVALAYRPETSGQHVERIEGATGWLKYMSKHASRGVGHYQRAEAGIPAGWEGNTGRVWRRGGEWPTREPVVIQLNGRAVGPAWFYFRRLLRSWRLADARADRVRERRPGRVSAARRMLKCSKAGLSRVRGVSEWIEPAAQDAVLSAVAARGYFVAC